MTTSTFVHIGDTHLGPGPRQVDRLRALDQIIGECERLPSLAAWLWPGDIFHQRSSIDDRNALKERAKRMADVAPVVMCYGNHDAAGDLDIFGDLAATWPVHVIATPTVLRVRLAGNVMKTHRQECASIFVLPYPTAAGLVSDGVAPALVVQEARQLMDAIFIDAAAKLAAARRRGDVALMIGHVNVAGSISSVGQPQIGQEIELDGALLDRLGDCPKLLSHIHKSQAVGNAVYAGSICRLNWGEVEPKSYTLATIREDGSYGIEHRSIDVPPLYHVEGWLSRAGFTNVDVTAGPDGESIVTPPTWAGCEVRVRARYHQSEGAILEAAQKHVRAQFADALRFEFEPICVPDRGLRAPEVAAARTLQEKLAAWATIANVVLPADVTAKANHLEHFDPEALVALVEERMATLTDLTSGTTPTTAPDARTQHGGLKNPAGPREGPVVPADSAAAHTPTADDPEARDKESKPGAAAVASADRSSESGSDDLFSIFHPGTSSEW